MMRPHRHRRRIIYAFVNNETFALAWVRIWLFRRSPKEGLLPPSSIARVDAKRGLGLGNGRFVWPASGTVQNFRLPPGLDIASRGGGNVGRRLRSHHCCGMDR